MKTAPLWQRLSEVQQWAANLQVCKRKAVGCFMAIDVPKEGWVELCRAHNGPSVEIPCTNEVGNCGCAHSEPRVLIQTLNILNRDDPMALVCQFSPCTNCANIIVDAKRLALPNLEHVLWVRDTEHDMRGIDILRAGGLTIHRR